MATRLTMLYVLLLALVSTVHGCIWFPLDSDKWKVENENKSISITATVPGGIYTDLRKAGVLQEDVFYRLNDQEYRWVARDNWTYSTVFDVTDDLMKKTNVFLTFHGLDTIAKIYFNNHYLGETSNMFVRFRFDVKSLLQKSNNVVSVHFTSPITSALSLAKEDKYEVPPACVNKEYNGECHANYLRKMQASFGWDWGPAFPSMGIWKSVFLEGYNNAFGRSISVLTHSEGDDWDVRAKFHVELPRTVEGVTLIMELKESDETIMKITKTKVKMVPDDEFEGSYTFNFKIKKNKVKTWWPNGLGDQPLYYLKCIFRKPDEDTDAGVMMGFRTVELVQEKIDEDDEIKGLSFYFKVNDVPFFAKGTNLIPTSILPELSAEPNTVESLLQSMKEANMNMVRVWGGGVYESDYFYSVADKLGLLVWQDLTFACSMYPAGHNFLTNVAKEAQQQVRRLHSHPSLAVWTANNENEGALRNNWYNTNKNYSLFENDYISLYVRTLKNIVNREDVLRPFMLSSSSNGKKTEEEGGVAQDPQSPLYGDVHFYDYYDNLWTLEPLPSTRFASEYGVMSMPSVDTLLTAANEWELTLESQVMQSRQHHLGGYSEMLIEIAQNLPPITTNFMDTFVYFSQINQAMAIKTQTENYRRHRNTLDKKGRGMTMGALYWQLNDVWQAPSWSSIDFKGRWKMLHYFAKNFFHPVLISPALTSDDKLALSLISDKLNNLDGVNVTMYIYSWRSLSYHYKTSFRIDMTASHVTPVFRKDITSVLRKAHHCGNKFSAKKRCFLYFEVRKNNEKLGPDNFLFPTPLHSVDGMKNATIKVKKIKKNIYSPNGSFIDVTLSTNAVAAFVWLEVSEMPGHFSDNGFLFATDTKTVTFYGESPVDVQQFRKCLKIKSLGSVSR